MTPATEKKLTLFELERELVELIEFAEDAKEDEEIVAAQHLIGKYLEQRAVKVDNIRAYLKHCEMMAQAANDEAATQIARGNAWDARAQRLKDACVRVMQDFGEKKLPGRTGELRLHANPPAVEVTNAELVPDEYTRAIVRMCGELWTLLYGFLQRFQSVVQTLSPALGDLWYARPTFQVAIEPDKTLLKAALQSSCEFCEGLTDKERSECSRCNGTGKQSVPGARLVTDRAHLRIT